MWYCDRKYLPHLLTLQQELKKAAPHRKAGLQAFLNTNIPRFWLLFCGSISYVPHTPFCFCFQASFGKPQNTIVMTYCEGSHKESANPLQTQSSELSTRKGRTHARHSLLFQEACMLQVILLLDGFKFTSGQPQAHDIACKTTCCACGLMLRILLVPELPCSPGPCANSACTIYWEMERVPAPRPKCSKSD